MGEMIFSVTTGAGIAGYLCGGKEMKLDSYLYYIQKLI